MEASKYGHVEAVRLLLARGADVNAKTYVSACECTDVSVALVCLCVVLLVCMLLLSITICTCRSAIIVIVLIPVMVGWGDRVDGLLLWRPLRRDMWKL